MTPDEAQIREQTLRNLEARATPGQWQGFYGPEAHGWITTAGGAELVLVRNGNSYFIQGDDAVLIAALRNFAIPIIDHLKAEIERLSNQGPT